MTQVHLFILNTAEKYYNNLNIKLSTKAEDAISDFINNSQILLLQCFLENDSNLVLHTKIQENKFQCLIFYKSSAQELTHDEAIKNINIVSVSNNVVESLYQTLRQIYSPLLSMQNDLYSSKVQKNFLELESNLRSITHGKGDGNMNVILSMEDELDYWKVLGQRKESSKKEKEAASNFCELFEDICEEIRTMQSSPMEETREAAENIGGILDDVWRFTVCPYSQDRMIHTFDVIGHIICTTIQKVLSNVDLWKVQNISKDSEILTLLSDSLKVIQTWTSACKSLTETYWPNYALHPWTGKPYVPTFCVNFQNRMKEVHDIRTTHNQLNKLLSPNERFELMTDQLFKPFEDLNIWICNGPSQSWENAVARFSASLRPSEAKIAEKLRPRLHNTSTKQMLYEFMRYRTLIERPLVKQSLNNELEIFVSSLLAMLKSVQMQMDADDVDVQMHQPPEMSPIVQQVQWAKQMEAKVKDIQTCAEKYLKEFEGSVEVLKLSAQVLKDLKNMYTQMHEEWSRELQAQVKNGSLRLSLDKPVVEFSASSKMMVVNYNPRLVWCELEARALSALGLPPPAAAASIDTLSAALKHARALQQVASFHNTLGERMIPSTRPMMLQAALDLSSLVQDQKAVYWNDTEQLANYTDKLKAAVMKLETQNSYLTTQHLSIRNIVKNLLDTDLLAKQSDWKKKIKDIRDIIEKVESNGYNNTEVWRSHWDWQIYKVLECQYIKTLLSLHKHFPHVKVDLVLRGHKVRVQPPLEEIRVQHYHQLRRLISLPAHFVGVQASYMEKSIFTNIVDKHGWLGNNAVKQLEAALSALERTCESWTKRAALACVPDLEALCSQNLHEPEHWEINFKACKAYGQTVAKMMFEDEKIDWIIVGTATLRREFEAQARNLWACLMTSLQASCRTDASTLDAFVANAMLLLEEKTLPKNAKELAEISGKQQSLQGKMPEMETLVDALKRKGHLLRTWGGDASADSTIKEWLKIKELLLTHQQMFEHQADIVKSSLSGDWENLNSSVESWLSRLDQARSRYEETHGATHTDMLDRCRSVFEAHAQWEKYLGEKNELLKECQKFKMDLEIPEIWNQAEKLINEYVQLWEVMKEYDEELSCIAEQEWIVFQKKLHLLDEFVAKWLGRLEPYTNVTLYLQQQLDQYNELTTLLKYLRGSDFTERHWREVFSLLDMEYKKPDTLQVKDFLSVALNIKTRIKDLQKICATASSEAAVRSALNELELWFAGARLAIIYYNDKAKRPTPIVKDFKDILAKIEEQQWVVSSVSGGGGSDSCAAWESRLRAARSLVRAAHHAQRRWLYLEPILSSDDGELGSKFRKVDLGFRQVTRILEADARLSALLQSTRLQPMLDSISEQLLACQSALNQYIDEKRSIFPRLYFLSDDDLLELLGQARAGAEGREAVMQTHLKKLFPGTTGVRLGPGGLSITALCTHYEEALQLDHPVDIDCPVELWLKNLEIEMRASLKNVTLKCITTSSLQEQDPFSLPTQILCLAQNIRFTEQAEKAITSKELYKLKSNIEKESLYYASAEVEDECERIKRQALILQCAYYSSIIRILIDNNVASINDWLWQKQLRFYLTSSKEVVAKMGLAQIPYSYEYLGVNTGQFVRTELADECFLVLTQALHLGLVGNPFGPAGTGKTESVKALGGLVGRLVLIFNCDEGMDSECMGRLLTGLALSGSWGCFDEFNRLTADTLAAVSHQLASLLHAMQQRNGSTALLNGKQVCVSEWCGVAATMNPVGRGYGGRRALPAALERVLRPIAMTQPRGDQLAKHLLAARCVSDAETLARDLHSAFIMASTLLSGQRHYDWGLRALKATVGSCGSFITDPSDSKQAKYALRRALRVNSVSKLTNEDAERFDSILSTVFGSISEENAFTDPVISALETSVTTLGLIHNKLQIQKSSELYEQLQQRMGVVIVGPPGSGKTTIRKLLKTALTQQGKTIVEYTICPKAMSRSWLLGSIDHDTRQWTDGVISSTALEISNQPLDVWSWVVCDGDIDPEWIEALNSVLDDNRLLTLPSGWRIQFGSNVNFIFETHSLEHASPATVSRMGIILLSEDSTCAQEVLDNWIKSVEFENENVKMALPLLQKVIKIVMQWLFTHRSDVAIKVYNVSVVKQIICQFEYLAQNVVGVNVIHTTPEELIFISLQRSIIGLLKEGAVDTFTQEMSDVLGPPPASPLVPGEWITENMLLSQRLATQEPAIQASVNSNSAHLLIIGPDACAKNLLAEYVLKESNYTYVTIDCTPKLEPVDIIAELRRNNVVRSSGRNTRASNNNVTILVRALHRVYVDSWGSSPIHSFLLQLIQEGGFWVRGGEEEGGMQWCGVCGVRVVATAIPSLFPPRLAAALVPVLLPEPEEEELLEIAKHYLRQNVDKNIQSKDVYELASAVLAMYKEITDTYYSRTHYKWSASHLRKWCENVKWYLPTNKTELIAALSLEANMIFKDRLVTEEEKSSFYSIAKSHFKAVADERYCLMPKLRGDGVYLENVDQKEWLQVTQKFINQCLSEHEANVFGDNGAEVCSEFAVLCPAFARATNGGIVVCVGSAGLGRRAAAHIVTAALSATLFFVSHPHQLNVQLKNALSTSAEGTRTLLVISEPAVDNNVLSIVESHTHAGPTDQISSQMMDNIKQNLGIVICLDKDQDNLSELLDKYPMLYNDGHLIWQEHWSIDSLRQMPQLITQRLRKENVQESTKETEAIPVEGFVSIYNSLEAEWLRAPCRYVNFIKSYYYIVSRKKAALLQRQTMLSAGLEALNRARSEVATLQEDAAKQESALSDKQAKANQALDQIGATVRATTDRKEEMHTLKRNIEVENEKLQIRKKEIEAELASVEPVIAAARAAVGDIKPESLSEVRSLRAPPDVVRDVLEGVLRLMGIADTSWHSMKNFLSKRGVKEDIRCLDASQISTEAVATVSRLLEKRGSSFEAATAKRASAAVAPLAAWVRANLDYAKALQRVQPLQLQQTMLHKNLKEAESQLDALSSGLATVDERVASLKEQLGQHTRDAATIELSLNNAKQTIEAARSLIDQLAHEYTAWENDLQSISKEISELTIRSLLAAAYIVYLPDVTEPQAREYINKWSAQIGFDDPTFSIINFLSKTEQQLKWEADGLPLDKSAIKNAILIDQILQSQKSGFTPLIIDPDGDAIGWLRNTLADAQCDFVSQHSDKLHTAVQYAVRLNRTLVITEVDGIHDSWAPLLLGLPVTSTATVSPVGARLLLYCRDSTLAARLPPSYAARISLLQFTARLDGLTDQLVHYALQQQNPEVNEKSKEMKLKKATLQKQQYELQENLLRDLSKNGDILHDANLLASLKKTRATSAIISEALEAAKIIQDEIRSACEAYEPSASRAAVLALAVKSLASQKPLVALPVDTILEIFVEAFRREGDTKNINNEKTIKYITRRVIERVLLGLHKKDKYIVVLHLLKQVYNDLIPDNLWQIVIGSHDVEAQGIINEIKQKYSWIPEYCLKKVALVKAASEELFNNLSLNNDELWNEFMRSGDIKLLSRLKLRDFEIVAAVSALRPDSTYRAVVAFVDQILGVGAMSAGEAIPRAVRGGSRGRPVLLLGAHAADVLAAHANTHTHTHTLTQVGIEEGICTWEAAVDTARSGGWVALIVGASPFTREFHTFLANFTQRSPEEFSDQFRLWIVSEDRQIPTLISNVCVNVILEAPEGVKHNVIGTLSAWGQYEGDAKLVRLHSCLALFHALVQERRAYIPQGWSRWYAWEWGEVLACTSIIRSVGSNIQTSRSLSLALYNARVATEPDRRLLAALLADCLGEHALGHSWKPRGLDIQLPFVKHLQAYTSAFDTMPEIDSALLLGLPANCRVAWERNAINDIIAGLRELDSTVSVTRPNDSTAAMKSLLSLWKKLMSNNPLIKADYSVVKKVRGWWGCVCGGEALEAARAARVLHSALALRARKLTQALAHHMHKVPDEWQLLWSGPDAPDEYIKEFCFRARAAITRIDTYVDTEDFMPTELDLRSLLRPERAIWALRVRTAARLGCSVNDLTLVVTWDADTTSASKSLGVLVRGLRVCGAVWGAGGAGGGGAGGGGGGLQAAGPRAPPAAPAPPLLLAYTPQNSDTRLEPEGTINIPVYSNESREQVLFEARAPLHRSLAAHTAILNTIALFIAPID